MAHLPLIMVGQQWWVLLLVGLHHWWVLLLVVVHQWLLHPSPHHVTHLLLTVGLPSGLPSGLRL